MSEEKIMRLLLVDDERDLIDLLQKVLSKKCKCEVQLAGTGTEAQKIVAAWRPDVVLTDILMPDGDGLQLLNYVSHIDPTITTIIMTGYGTIEMAVQALKDGAYDFFEKPFDNEKIIRVVTRALERTRLLRENKQLQQQLVGKCQATEFVGKTKVLRQTVELLRRLGQSDATVLIRGESGTGKEVAARTVHSMSKRADKKMITVNCPALPEQILESELFGYCKGAFTGADQDKKGLFLEAEGSTILLDEIADMPVSVQTKLLRVLQEKEIQPLGQTKTMKVDVRILASTNQDLEAKIDRGEFREDLYYRLNIMTVFMPSLTEIREDIPLLAQHFMKRYEQEYERPGMSFSPQALQYLFSQRWLGNVRELQNTINRVVLLAQDKVITVEDLACTEDNGRGHTLVKSDIYRALHHLPYKQAKEDVVSNFTVSYLTNGLGASGGNVSVAAKSSGMGRQAYQRLMRRYALQSTDFRR